MHVLPGARTPSCRYTNGGAGPYQLAGAGAAVPTMVKNELLVDASLVSNSSGEDAAVGGSGNALAALTKEQMLDR